MSDLSKSLKHFQRCHERWVMRVNRDSSSEDSPDEWVWNQCQSCRYWIPLSGEFFADWGACSNSNSIFDGNVRFSHDGCESYEQ